MNNKQSRSKDKGKEMICNAYAYENCTIKLKNPSIEGFSYCCLIHPTIFSK